MKNCPKSVCHDPVPITQHLFEEHNPCHHELFSKANTEAVIKWGMQGSLLKSYAGPTLNASIDAGDSAPDPQNPGENAVWSKLWVRINSYGQQVACDTRNTSIAPNPQSKILSLPACFRQAET